MIGNKRIPKFLIFLVTGGSNTLLCLIAYALLIKGGVPYLVASTLMFVYGVVQGYLLSTFFVFQHSVKFGNLAKYSMVYVFSYIFNIAILYFFVEAMGTSELVGQAMTSLLVATLNYLLVKKIVFQ